MKNTQAALVTYFTNVPDMVRRFRWILWILFIALTAVFFQGMGKAQFDVTVEGWFEDDDPTIVAFDWFHDQFGSEDHLYLVYRAKDGDVFSEQSLTAVRGIRQQLEDKIKALRPGDTSSLAHIAEITTLDNAPVLIAKQDVLVSRDLVDGDIPTTAAQREALMTVASSQKQFPKLYFSQDRHYGGIMIETDFGAIPVQDETVIAADTTMEMDFEVADDAFDGDGTLARPRFKPTEITDYIALMTEIKTIINQPQFADHLEYFPVGNTATMEHNLEMFKEMGMLNAGSLLMIALLLLLLFRSLSAVVWSIAIVILSIIWSVGIISLLGFPLTSFVMITVMLILTVGVANSVHVMSGYLVSVRKGQTHHDALRQAYRKTSVACLLTAVTTMVAMLTLTTTTMVPIKIFGAMSALGVGLTFLFTIYLLPLMLDLWGPAKWRGNKTEQSKGEVSGPARFLLTKLDRVLPVVERRPRAVMVAFLAMFVVCLIGSGKTKVDTNPLGQFPPESAVVKSFHVVDDYMMGTQSMEIYMDMGQINAFQDPFVLNEIDQLQQTFTRKYGHIVSRTNSIVDIVKSTNKTLHQENEDFYRIPPTKLETSQTLFLFNNADSKTRAKQVSDNYDRAHIAIRFLNTGSSEYVAVFEQMKVDIDATLARLKQHYPDAKISITGMLTLMMQGAEYLTHAQLESFALALLFVSVLLLLFFGSLKAGAISVIPNLIPAILAFGVLGWVGVPLDFTTMMIAPVIIGIAVDDTVHFLSRYRTEVQIDGDINRALHTTLKEAGPAIVFTSIVLGLGFGILGFSASAGTANVGILGALAIFAGLLNDLLFLPALILVFKLGFKAAPVPQAALSTSKA